MLHLSMEEKRHYRDVLKHSGTQRFDPPAGYMDCLKQVDQKEITITGREGQKITVWFTVPKAGRTRDMLYLNIHGGGFVQPHGIWDHALCAIMALEFSCGVLDIDYRLAPEHPHPASVIDCFDVYCWALEHADELKIDQTRIVVGGNSAGGTLTAGVCLKAKEEHVQTPALAVLIYPECGLSGDIDCPDLENGLDLTDLRCRGILFTLLYLESEEQLEDPYANLLKADEGMLKGFPDTILVTGGLDPLRFDAEEFGKHLIAAGAAVSAKRFLDSKHGFYVRLSGQWQKAREFVFGEIRHRMKKEEP